MFASHRDLDKPKMEHSKSANTLNGEAQGDGKRELKGGTRALLIQKVGKLYSYVNIH